jgi:hypothetical protein
VRQASQKPGASKDTPSRLKLKPTPSKDASNMWRKSITMLSSLTRMGTQQGIGADTAVQPHPDQAAAGGLASQDSSKTVWDQLAHGEGPLTMSIALQHTKSVPLGLEAVQEDEREGQGEPGGWLYNANHCSGEIAYAGRMIWLQHELLQGGSYTPCKQTHCCWHTAAAQD